MARHGLLFRPAAIAAGVVMLLAARWIWVAGLGDYGWTWEAAARLLAGQVYYRDFTLLYGPLSHYTLAAWMWALGPHLFHSHLHLWFWYALALVVGLRIARELGAGAAAQSTGVAFAAVMGCPAFSWGHAFNYQAPCLAGAAILCLLRARRAGGPTSAAAAGVAAALAIYAKQNVGLAVTVLIPFLLPRGSRRAYAGGLAGAFVPILWYFSSRAGWEEVLRQLFLDPAAAKQGPVWMVLRAAPRLILPPEVPGRRWWEVAATLAALGALLPLVKRLARRTPAGEGARRPVGRPAEPGPALLAAAVLGIATSLLNVEWNPPAFLLPAPWTWLQEGVYLLLALLTLALWRGFDATWRAAALPLLAVTAVQESSNPNFVYSAPLAVPLLAALLDRAGVVLRPPVAGAALAAVCWIATAAVGPPWRYGLCAYRPTYPLPSDSPWAGLRAPREYREEIRELWTELRPHVEGRTTLWLVAGGGPFLAFGGHPVSGAACYMPDTIPPRLYRKLVESWRAQRPEVVVVQDDFRLSPQDPDLAAESIRQTIAGGHRQVWRSRRDPRLSAWAASGGSAKSPGGR